MFHGTEPMQVNIPKQDAPPPAHPNITSPSAMSNSPASPTRVTQKKSRAPSWSTPQGTSIGDDEDQQRLIVVSNRLPVTISKDDKGEYHFKASHLSPFSLRNSRSS